MKRRDHTLNWMFANLPQEDWNLKTYVQINWCGDKTVEEVIDDAELASELPEELFPAPETGLIQ